MVQVVTDNVFGQTAVPAAIVRDGAIPTVEEEQHLGVPIIGRERPAMTEHDRLPGAPVLVEDLSSP